MALRLPNFKGRRCRDVSFCGFIDAEASSKVENLPILKKASVTACYMKSDVEVFMRLMMPFPWHKERIHLHFELAVRESFRKPPRTNATPEELLALVEPFSGQNADVGLKGEFRAKKSEVPSFIRATFFEFGEGDIQMRMTGGTLSIKGLPVHTISWKQPEDDEDLKLSLHAQIQVPLSDGFFDTGLDLLDSLFKAFTSGSSKHEPG